MSSESWVVLQTPVNWQGLMQRNHDLSNLLQWLVCWHQPSAALPVVVVVNWIFWELFFNDRSVIALVGTILMVYFVMDYLGSIFLKNSKIRIKNYLVEISKMRNTSLHHFSEKEIIDFVSLIEYHILTTASFLFELKEKSFLLVKKARLSLFSVYFFFI
eukprot:TRINITY_DN649_c0_g1_i2.p1 TRINITY_DN649_c0_g1~~TRINITY_DN649_c0_g1_i2.p1  ORF type:complete len:159 (+),score=32.56 TRINITY_DN649_c0_g1_i2:163-639(+)